MIVQYNRCAFEGKTLQMINWISMENAFKKH